VQDRESAVPGPGVDRAGRVAEGIRELLALEQSHADEVGVGVVEGDVLDRDLHGAVF
jgi:hypothetical protein